MDAQAEFWLALSARGAVLSHRLRHRRTFEVLLNLLRLHVDDALIPTLIQRINQPKYLKLEESKSLFALDPILRLRTVGQQLLAALTLGVPSSTDQAVDDPDLMYALIQS